MKEININNLKLTKEEVDLLRASLEYYRANDLTKEKELEIVLIIEVLENYQKSEYN